MNLFILENISDNDKLITFDKNESRHICKVLRYDLGDKIFATNGKGVLFSCEIIDINHKKCIAKIIKIEKKEPQKHSITLAIAPTKSNDRYNWMVEKSVEIGVNKIIPIICKNSERRTLNIEKIKKTVISASKQSLKFYLPKVKNTIKLEDLIKNCSDKYKFVAYCGKEIPKKTIKNLYKKNENCTILIGPEGDFSKDEIQLALQNGFQIISLGENRLRTETAGVFAVSTIQILNQ